MLAASPFLAYASIIIYNRGYLQYFMGSPPYSLDIVGNLPLAILLSLLFYGFYFAPKLKYKNTRKSPGFHFQRYAFCVLIFAAAILSSHSLGQHRAKTQEVFLVDPSDENTILLRTKRDTAVAVKIGNNRPQNEFRIVHPFIPEKYKTAEKGPIQRF